MSLHSNTGKLGTTEFLSQPVGHATFPTTVDPSRVQTTIVKTTSPTRVREVKTVTTEVSKHTEGISAGEIPNTIIYTDPSTQTRGGQVITTEPSVIKARPISPVRITTTSQVYGGIPNSQVYGGGVTSSQVYGGGVTSSQVYGGGIPTSQLYGSEIPVAKDLTEHGHGNIVFRPIEGKFYKNDGYGEMIDPYCKVKIGHHTQKGSISNTGGVQVVWNDLIKLERKHKEKFAKLKCKDKNKVNMHGKLGYCKVDLNEVAEKGKICGWFPLYNSENDDKITGEILLEVQDLSAGGAAVL